MISRKNTKSLWLSVLLFGVLCSISWSQGDSPYLNEIQITEKGKVLYFVVQIKNVELWISAQGELQKMETVSKKEADERGILIEEEYIQTADPQGTYCEFLKSRLVKVDYHQVLYETVSKKILRKGRRVRMIGPMTFTYRGGVMERINHYELKWSEGFTRLEGFGGMRLLYRLGTGNMYQIWSRAAEDENTHVRIVYEL